ncbi:DUF4241 domain-containing protein [Pseudogemmobacter humi]|uniref:DUF4241 domain-containing protein n=1 Tax=Pseudogemmobacter humi TaxID=2483812 RepID=A0A3P5X9J5_9RHOB|nr:DUF4241 domain-containing protein [Pseudogemmobacter humi]VDC31351.1 hypothetical protein XINFAN_02847 [Pseudogemmobacter humi]
MIRLLALLLSAGPALADMPGSPIADPGTTGALAWMAGESALPLDFRTAGPVAVAPGGVIVVDPLTYDPGYGWPFIAAPSGEARLILAIDPAEQRVSKAMLVFSDAPVLCGADVATVGVDTGLVSFLDQPMSEALGRAQTVLGPGKDLYNDWFHELIGEIWVVGHLLPLPDGTVIPMSSSGWGDGGYPVVALQSGTGQVVAIYADFMGRNEAGDWLLPASCTGV